MSTARIDRFSLTVLAVAAAMHFITAWYSSGYYSADEHYQLIEFAEARAGHQPESSLAWEYGAQIRSSLQPVLCMGIFSAARSVGVTDPFMLAFLLRTITACLALIVVLRFVRSTLHLIPLELRRAFVLLSFFLWFLPYQHVRFSGETWSGLFFLLGLSFVLQAEEKRMRFLWVGVCFGAAFLFRAPTALLSTGALCWLIAVQRGRRKHIAELIAGALVVIIIGIALDSWFYQGFTLTAWNYMRMGITGDATHAFTPFAWWYYFAWIIKYGLLPIGAVLLLAFAALLVLRPKSIIVWAMVPFLLFHVLLPHKELRFLFPLVDLMPIMMVMAWQALTDRSATLRSFARSLSFASVCVLLALVNVAALVIANTTAAGTSRTLLAEQLWHADPSRTQHVRYVANDTSIWDIRIPRFYLPPNVVDDGLGDACAPQERTDLLIAHEVSGVDAPCADHWEPIASNARWNDLRSLLYNGQDPRPWILFRRKPLLP